ncbi:D-hexose-6-phosphate mutarotase [Catenovulum sp. SM1970]|uniref:D-hexose-6-phosphate mutarotase n=1 Tax=Marinifaba aquimaris TaxID=2741323 RepID=UPI0015720C7B|nr:D-hexose-6-phosphate mutarotase [Marinifaba aquimaris]NTS76974.1 D-hexose-6-phosphate mutarotase [Marinifaba aquimaris]
MKNPFINSTVLEQISNELSLRQLDSGLSYWWVETTDYQAAIAVTGGQLIWFTQVDHSEPVIWLSENSHMDDSKSLRGGVPICWPWFGRHRTDKTLPSHGLVRNIAWKLVKFDFNGKQFNLSVSPDLTALTTEYRALIQDGIELTQTLTFDEQIEIKLTTKNTGTQSYEFSAALHTYFNVGDIQNTELHGLVNSHYIAEATNWESVDAPKLYRFREQTDRVHIDRCEHAEIESPIHTYELTHSGNNSLIVWNPWQEVSEQTPGMGAEVWKGMLCVEPAAFKPYLNLKSGESHSLQQIIKIIK